MTFKIIVILMIVFFLSIPVFVQIALEWEMLPESDRDNLNYPFDNTSVTTNDYKRNVGVLIVFASTKVDTAKVPTLVLSNSLFYSNRHLVVKNWPEYTIDG